ncbi:MAG: hypothetical protein A3C49_03410 [Candidatus Doudnabacteria bacterium RIFCSPHIGHO2_02_FULL_42_25]|uniref:Fe2OG dioxygenase domain-containing protein n=1 Tax=Candidatus Doudnabacteria bacterium RIFCSPHIGHO2_01_FULL_41_86 TaxID=1817821 RepID=A0A1F5N825_9BACT|nr:MAG: hypothetical protein A2717_04385 [Candidatus Doudnabacteria bacterium RIFCSPHIGHO2_01_FULL_41_86]OGE75850.1 MAG: hypothetical protein A3K07_03980 [Candidatus Doudnabacteria bacterium RIFCSPHIGHO2_01_43_10]OGE86224.1 MAG: hypothetical protein A3E28_03740 [Candidatus Doudnabacteria bacterium RIFCSPHIGHO2_12_FULL_42_22]OGE87073.1 MAG: hypothetical protein A3C49_03410 [Candidatus Doudnabacteria bacterium RIFCSPHIGHO2_02_FULL_42_25]OGE92925.1 MAG: hypothetical protein A3K08_00930 [Candidatus
MQSEQTLQTVIVDDVALFPLFVPEGLQQRLLREFEGLSFKDPEAPQCKLVRQDFDKVQLNEIPHDMPALDELDELVQNFVQLGTGVEPNLSKWFPNEIVIQRYTSAGHITGHKDSKKHRLLVAIVNLAGSCHFDILTCRDGQPVIRLTPKAGDLILMKASGLLSDQVDDRPFHQVSGNLDESVRYRISVGFRCSSLT